MAEGRNRNFLFLQGPHGPAFDRLAAGLGAAGARTSRIAFNAGDGLFWHREAVRYRDGAERWPEAIAAALDAGVTDLVLYAASRPGHVTAARAARARGIRVHTFEEGYLRPWWVTYEREGTNGTSRLMEIDLADMARAVGPGDAPAAPPARWGDLSAHVGWAALYHAAVLAGGPPGLPPHRELPLSREMRLALRRVLTMPLTAPRRRLLAARALARPGRIHAVLLQLAHDANFRDHGPFADIGAFLDHVIGAFAESAPGEDRLVFRAHPLDDDRAGLARAIRTRAAAAGIAARTEFLRAGRLAPLLDRAATAVTVNSTAADQALLRGLPVAALGRAVYRRPGLASSQDLAAFFRAPEAPDPDAYAVWRRFLLSTSQLPGGFYAARARRRLVPAAVAAMLADRDPYDRLLDPD